MKKTLAAVVAMAIAFGGFAGQVCYDTGSGVKDLSSGSAWVGGTAPGADDVAVLSGVGGTFTFSADTEWKGLVFGKLTDTLTLSSEKTLTLGASGIDVENRVAPGHPLILRVPVALSCDQDWYTLDKYNGIISIYCGVQGPGKLTTRNIPNVGGAYFAVNSPVGTSWNAYGSLNVIGANAAEGTTNSIAGDVHLNWDHELHLLNFNQGETRFRDVIRSRGLTNDGAVCFGRASGTAEDIRADVLFEAGDVIAGDETLRLATAVDSEDSRLGFVHEKLGKFRMTGGGITNNTFYLRGGDFDMTGGSIWLRYRFGGVIGSINTGQRFFVHGSDASIDANSIELGTNNRTDMPNWLVVSNGFVRARTRARLAGSDSQSGANSRLEVGGSGKVEVGGLAFGWSDRDSNSNAYAKVEVKSGAELAVGRNGVIARDPNWNGGGDNPESPNSPWYRFCLSGGLYRAFASQDNTAEISLEGSEIQVDEGVVMNQRGKLSGAASLVKRGKGVLALPQTCVWTGDTVVAEGTLLAGYEKSGIVPFETFSADDLAYADGNTVTAWKAISSNHSRTNSFTSNIASAIGIKKYPTFTSKGLGGHAAAVFDGSQALGMTGGTAGTSNDGPLSEVTNFTAVVVFRGTNVVNVDDSSESAFYTAGLIGQEYNLTNSRWILGVDKSGQVVGAVSKGDGACELATGRTVLDGKPHVAAFNWTAGGQVRICVDGFWSACDDSSGVTAISRNRMVLGASESTSGNDYRYLAGAIAAVQLYRNDLLSTNAIAKIVLEQALAYGAACTVGAGEAAVAATPAEDPELPNATGIWRADDLSVSAGAQVSVWTDAAGNGGEFTSAIGKAIHSDSAAPVLSSRTLNGHKAVYFDGNKKMLGMTGTKGSTYIGAGTNFTVVLVVKAENAANNKADSAYPESVGLIGQGYTGNDTQNKWGVGIVGGQLPDSERLVMGIRDGIKGKYISCNAYGKVRYLNDGHAHVLICSYGTNLTINVDGYRTLLTNATACERQADARTTLGCLESYLKQEKDQSGQWQDKRTTPAYFKGDIAEFRFYADTTLSVAQQNALGRELAVKYGIDAGGYYGPDETAFASKRLTVAAGARVMGAGAGFRLPADVRLDGAGEIAGRFVFGAGSVYDATDVVPTFATGSTAVFEGGATVRLAEQGGKPVPVAFDRVEWPTAGGLTVDVSALGASPRGVVFTWIEGKAPDTSDWTVVGGDGATKFVVDAEAKCVKVKSQRGVLLIFR